MFPVKSKNLNNNSFLHAVHLLEDQDHDLRFVISRYGVPPFWKRKPGFQALLYIILEQQVSLASAKAAYDKLVKATRSLTPESFLNLKDIELKAIGFSRQKTQYGRNLAESILQKSLDLSSLNYLDDAAVKKELMKVKGIGSWTADIYLLMAVGRPDIWPSGDLALRTAVQRLKCMPHKPSAQELDDLNMKWRPWRAVAARILWHFYLSCCR